MTAPAANQTIRELIGPLTVIKDQQNGPLGGAQGAEKAVQGDQGANFTRLLGAGSKTIARSKHASQRWNCRTDRWRKFAQSLSHLSGQMRLRVHCVDESINDTLEQR